MNERIENTYTLSGRIANPTEQDCKSDRAGSFIRIMSIFSKIFRPISDPFRPWLKCPETKGFAAFWAKFSDLKRVGRNSRFFLQNALPFCIFAVRELRTGNR